jgi:hypothetical protein
MSANVAVPTPAAVRETVSARLQTRYRLLIMGGVSVLLSFIVIAQATNAYATAYNLFEDIAVRNSTKVDAAEQALQNIASASQATADYAVLTSDTPLYEAAQNNIFRYFNDFRDQMFILRSNLESAEEETAFTVADTYTYSRFWRHVSNLLSQRSNLDAARREYLSADNHLRNRIIPALQQLEAVNFDEMVESSNQAGAVINTQIVLLAIPALALALLLTFISFRVRQIVHRYITPGIDAAMILGWVLLLLMFLELASLSGSLEQMTLDAYANISGSSRALVAANQANRAESSAIIDSGRADYWYTIWDENVASVELRLCGQPGCTDEPFLDSTTNRINVTALNNARAISPENLEAIDGLTPLIAGINTVGELQALEDARVVFNNYRRANIELRKLIAADDLAKATLLNTKIESGTSEDAFNSFVQNIEEARSLNRLVFDEIWFAQQNALPRNQVLYGVVGYGLVIVLVLVGVYHRYREL